MNLPTSWRDWRDRYRQMRRDAAYLLLAWPLNVVAFTIAVTLIALGAGTVIIWIGIPILVLGLEICTYFADMERRAVAAVDSSEYVPGYYLRTDPGDGTVQRLLTTLRDPQRWLDLGWVFVGLFVTAVTWALSLTWLVTMFVGWLGMAADIIVDATLPRSQTLAGLLGLRPALLWQVLLDLALWVLFTLTAPFVLRALTRARQAFSRALLCQRSEVARLETSRAAVQRAEADTRRQLERDIHDGPQQRLVRLGMDLARAKRQAVKDPQAAEGIISGAMDQTQQTLDELRRLSRGIAPPVLTDRGLSAALAEVAARSTVPVTVHADLPPLPDHISQAAYFVASEALTNLNKHSGAHSAELGAVIETEQLRLWIADDGVGGASLAKGHGLAGLVERLEGVDGRLTVTSPAGGPTRVEAVIPCAS